MKCKVFGNFSILFAVIIIFTLCVTIIFAQSPSQNPSLEQKAPLQKLPQPIQESIGTGKVQKFLIVVRDAKSLEEVQSAFTAANFSKTETEEVKKQIETSASLKQKLDGLVSGAATAARSKREQFTRLTTSRTATLSKQMNDKRIADYNESVRKIRQSTDPTVRCMADTPTITTVSSVTPGVEFAVRGNGFGEYPGNVELVTVGYVFSAHITGWNSCTIYAQLGDYVSGVRANSQATVSITTTSGKKARGWADFKPALETKERSKDDWIYGGFWGASGDFTYWDFTLRNDWFVVSTNLRHYYRGHAEITSAAATNIPNGSTRTQVHAGVPALGYCSFDVIQSLAGPRGLSYK